jgi:predicted DsbA family dithiol-disulfide isomerase
MPKLQVYFDFTCPYCYLGKGYFDRFREENPDVPEPDWVSWELHPEYPPEGVRLPRSAASDRLREMGRPVGRTFGDPYFVPNTRQALQAVGHARSTRPERASALVERLFIAYWAESRDLGSREELLALAAEVGIDAAGLKTALEEGRHVADLEANDRRAERELKLEVVPSFIREGKLLLAGSTRMTYEEFREKARVLRPTGV